MIEFPDISHYQAGLSLQNAVAVVAKVSQGADNADSTYAGFRAQALTLGITAWSGYHWVDGSSPTAQALNYVRHAAGAPCMLDVEAAGGTVAQTMAVASAIRAQGGRVWGAYLPHWWWQDHLGSPDLRPLAAAGLALVSSNYNVSPLGAGWAPYGGVTPTVWQYTDKRVFNGVPCDFNRYQGTAAQLAALFNGSTMEDGDMPKLIRVGADGTTLAGSYWLCTGPSRYWLRTQADLAAACAFWGLDPNVLTVHTVTSAQLGAYGADVQAAPPAGPSAEVDLAAVAKAVNDETARRLLG